MRAKPSTFLAFMGQLVMPVATAGVAAIVLTACQTVPAQTGLNAAQVTLLKKEGFVETPQGWEFSMADKLLFASDSDVVRGEEQANVARIANALMSVAIDRARVEGHTDATGTANYNQTLSLKRAGAVADAMAKGGFAKSNIVLKGWGEAMPVAVNATGEGRQENRRVVIIIAAD